MERMFVIGNPGNRRTAALQQARNNLGLSPAVELSYMDLLQGKSSLTEVVESNYAQFGAIPPLLRIDAPGEQFEVEVAMIALGAPDARRTDGDERLLPYGHLPDSQHLLMNHALSLKEKKGKLYHPSQWFRGYGRLLARLDTEARGIWGEHTRWLNDPAEIISMFDKRHTHEVLSAAGIPVPKRLAVPEEILDYDSLHEQMNSKRMHRVFIKLASGSGACGVIAYQINPRTGAEVAITSLGVENYIAKPPLYYNVKKLQRYTDRSIIKPIINWLLLHGAHTEQWIAKASFGDRTFDIRQLVVSGEACHRVARVSRTPITNLHLLSERYDLEKIGLAEDAQEAVKHTAEAVAAVYSHSAIAGIDVLLSSGSQKPYVVDVNPFGDLLYGVNYQGYDAYEWELRRLMNSRWDPITKVGSN